MRERIFRFKQFAVTMERSAMKVGTDGVLLGAWAQIPDGAKRVLDVGTGTGLISLMLAQRYAAPHITAIDIDEGAVAESAENFLASPWANRLASQLCDFATMPSGDTEKFDAIVSNPPYFVDSLQCPSGDRTLARHTASLSFTQLLTGAKRLLASDGLFSIIVPTDADDEIARIAREVGFHISRKTSVIPVVGGSPKRTLWEMSLTATATQTSEITIEISRHVYHSSYIELTKDFYLKM